MLTNIITEEQAAEGGHDAAEDCRKGGALLIVVPARIRSM